MYLYRAVASNGQTQVPMKFTSEEIGEKADSANPLFSPVGFSTKDEGKALTISITK